MLFFGELLCDGGTFGPVFLGPIVHGRRHSQYRDIHFDIPVPFRSRSPSSISSRRVCRVFLRLLSEIYQRLLSGEVFSWKVLLIFCFGFEGVWNP